MAVLTSKPEYTHVVGKPDQCVLSPVQIEMIALVRVVADKADLLVCDRVITIEDGPSTDWGNV